LRNLNVGKVYDSQANYVLVDLGDNNSTKIAQDLINDNIFIKDLRTKKAFEGKNFIRLAVRTGEENELLVKKLEKVLRK
ncbi:MAG: aminotransferase, partial [Bacilli bacterium]|nr:aminotransferase [Bacilli bacterium]